MNERIKELALQASYSIIETDGSPIISNEFNKEKFAELIIRECSTLAFDGPNGILEHFGLGVEE